MCIDIAKIAYLKVLILVGSKIQVATSIRPHIFIFQLTMTSTGHLVLQMTLQVSRSGLKQARFEATGHLDESLPCELAEEVCTVFVICFRHYECMVSVPPAT